MRGGSGFPIWPCSRWGLPCRRVLPPTRCALTAPFHPCRSREGLGRSALCCTFRGLTPPRRYLAPDPPEPGLSSTCAIAGKGSDCPADSRYARYGGTRRSQSDQLRTRGAPASTAGGRCACRRRPGRLIAGLPPLRIPALDLVTVGHREPRRTRVHGGLYLEVAGPGHTPSGNLDVLAGEKAKVIAAIRRAARVVYVDQTPFDDYALRRINQHLAVDGTVHGQGGVGPSDDVSRRTHELPVLGTGDTELPPPVAPVGVEGNARVMRERSAGGAAARLGGG